MRMKLSKTITVITLVLCIVMSLCACAQQPDPAPTSGSETVAPTSPTAPAPDPETLYETAVSAIENASNLVVEYGFSETRVVGNESYTENRSGTASYVGWNTGDPEALVAETLTCGSYTTQYIESYLNGSGWCRVNNCNFRSDMTAAEFYARQIPAVLLDKSLYSTVTMESAENGAILYFAGATALESWIADAENAQLVTANGKLELDAAGHITAGSYHAEFTRMTTVYVLEVTVNISQPEKLEISTQQPVYPEDCAAISDLQSLRYLLRVVGDVYTAKNMAITYFDTVYSQAFGQIRTHSSTYDTYGSGDQFMAAMTNQVGVTDYTGVTVTNTQTATFLDGQYSYRYNNGETTVDSAVTADQVRTNWEDSILSALIMPDYIAGTQITDTGDFLSIEFTGNETLAKALCSNIYTTFGVDLDAFAESYSTEYVKGYLALNKYTGLPTAMGISLSRSHVINGVTYRLIYQLDQSLELSSNNAYKNITGEEPAETGTDTASPLFYKVTGSDGQIMWLLGTIHVGDCRTANLPKQLTDAFSSSDAVAIECNNDSFIEAMQSDSALQQQVSNAYYYSDGSTVSSHISDDLYSRLLPLMIASGTNNMNGPYLKTIFWQSQIETLYLQQSYALSSNKGVETRLLSWAAQQDKKVYEVESVLAQLQVLSGLSEDLQEMLLEQTLELGMAGTYAEVSALYELWCQGNETALTEALATDTSGLSEEEAALMAEYQKALMTDRNQGMLSAAAGYLESGETVFYAVGLGHLLGEGGLVELLRDAGYTVEIVTYE